MFVKKATAVGRSIAKPYFKRVFRISCTVDQQATVSHPKPFPSWKVTPAVLLSLGHYRAGIGFKARSTIAVGQGDTIRYHNFQLLTQVLINFGISILCQHVDVGM